MRKAPSLEDGYPEFHKEFEETKPSRTLSKVDSELPDAKPCRERPEGWWKEDPQSQWITDRGREPTAFELLHDFIIGKVMSVPEAVSVASLPPTRLYHFKIDHPERGREEARLTMNPTDVMEGAPDQEPDLVLQMDYYCLVGMLLGEVPVFTPIYEGRAKITGNMTAGMDLSDVLQCTHGLKIPSNSPTPTPRPDVWPCGHP